MADYRSIVLADEPVFYFRLDESSGAVKDTAGILASTAPSGAVTYGEPSVFAGEMNTSMRFDGATGRIALSRTGIAGSCTLEAWVKLNAIGSTQSIVSCGLNINTAGMRALSCSPAGHFVWTCGDDSDSAIILTSNFTSVTNVWYYVVGTLDASTKTLRLYVNGVLDATLVNSGGFAFKQDFLRIAVDPTNVPGVAQWNGWIDEVACFTKPLSATRILEKYYRGQGQAPPPPTPDPPHVNPTLQTYADLVLVNVPRIYWRMNDSVDPLVDASGNGFVGNILVAPGTYLQPSKNLGLGTCIAFAGNQSYRNTAAATSAAVTLECWFKPTALSGTQRLVSVGSSTSVAGSASLFLSGTSLVFGVVDTSLLTNTLSFAANLVNGQWYHVVGVADPTTRQLSLYLNGQQVASMIAGNTLSPADNGLLVAARPGGIGQSFIGSLDEVAWYERVLAASDVVSHYQFVPPAPVPVATATTETGRRRWRERWYTCSRCGKNFPESRVVVQVGLVLCDGQGTTQCADEPGAAVARRKLRLPREIPNRPLSPGEEEIY